MNTSSLCGSGQLAGIGNRLPPGPPCRPGTGRPTRRNLVSRSNSRGHFPHTRFPHTVTVTSTRINKPPRPYSALRRRPPQWAPVYTGAGPQTRTCYNRV